MNFTEVARQWVDEGFNPLPLRNNKAPKLPKGHPYLYEPIEASDMFFANCEKIGIACGDVSGGFYCLDFDNHNGENIEAIFEAFFENISIQRLIQLNQLICYRTPSGGFHNYFRLPRQMPGTCISRWADQSVMIEIRGHGQYVATAPSQGYDYVAGCDLVKLEPIEEDTFTWMVDLALSFNKDPDYKEPVFKGGTSTRKWPDRWDETKVDGNFNNTQGAYAKQLLTEAGWRLIETRKIDGVELWQRPGKALEEGISATFGAKFNMFYNFSQNALPFAANTAYSPFNIYTILKHGGDWKKAKDSLRPPKEPPTEIAPTPVEGFPVDVFPEFIQDYITELNRTLNFHVDFSAAAVMFTVATINGNKYKLRVKEGWDAQSIFWFACVGYPGTIKTHPVKTLTKPLSTLDIASKKSYDKEMTHYDPEAKGKNKTPKPKFKQLLISDYTLEALHSIHDINRRGIGLYKDELKGFLNDLNKYRKGSDEEFWLESFNNGTYVVNRVTKEPILVKNICINIIGTIQHDVLSKVISEYKGNGLIDRFLFTASEATVYNLTTDEIDPYYADAWEELITKVNQHFDYLDTEDTEVLRMDIDTFAEYQKIDARYVTMQNSEDYSQEVKNYLSKMKTYVPRFALLLAIIESVCDGNYIEIQKKHMINAGRIADYFIKTAAESYSFNEAQTEIREMVQTMKALTTVEKIEKLAAKGIKQSEIARYFSLTKQYVSRVLRKK